MVRKLEKQNYSLHLLSGDNYAKKVNLQQIFGTNTPLLFNQTPQKKLDYIHNLKEQNKKGQCVIAW
ncbi:MAG: hypothetical protein C4329_05405 [Chitinophagaceae bacterium]